MDTVFFLFVFVVIYEYFWVFLGFAVDSSVRRRVEQQRMAFPGVGRYGIVADGYASYVE